MRADAVGRTFARTKWLSLLIFEPTLVGLSIYVALTAAEAWRRDAVIGGLAALLLLNLFILGKPPRFGAPLRWAMGMSLIAITGGPSSPLLPVLAILAVSFPPIVGRRPALVLSGLSIVSLWALTLLQARGNVPAYVSTACMTTLLAGAHVVGLWIRDASDRMLQLSLEARDEAVRTHGERLRELSKLQESLAHELKNPLASIKGLAGLVELDPARACERLAVLQKEVCRMQLILDDHLSFSRPLTPLVAELTDIHEVVAGVVRLHEGIARQKQLSLDMSGTERVELMGDPRKLRQMLMHLLTNAIDASERGGSISLAATQHGDRVRVGVLDRGPGLDAQMLSRAAEPGVTTKEHGSGLGLTIVRALAEQHGGSLRLRNREGGGLAAEVDLP
ncbi:MAG: Sensor protein, partial [Myxococcales bacterium]|nr:Sensor protein [Myxococcales bacterium]